MIKTISKIGNSQGLVFDTALMELARLKVGDEVDVEVKAGGTITLTPITRSDIMPNEAAKSAEKIITKNSELFRRLS